MKLMIGPQALIDLFSLPLRLEIPKLLTRLAYHGLSPQRLPKFEEWRSFQYGELVRLAIHPCKP